MPSKLKAAIKASRYSQRLADEICERLILGESLKQICRDERVPDERTIYRWLNSLPEFCQQYARAREAQMDRFGEELIEIADDGTNDWIKREHEGGRIEEIPDHEYIARSKLRVDSRKWLMSKLAPKKYGDKLAIGGDPEAPPLQVEHIFNLAKLTPEQLRTALALTDAATATEPLAEPG